VRQGMKLVGSAESRVLPRLSLMGRAREIPASCNARQGADWDDSSMPIRCLVVDDSPSFLDAARVLLEREGLTIAGVASSGPEAVRKAKALRPDVVLLDISLGDESGFDVARQLVDDNRAGAAAVILISTHTEADFADLIAESPAAGFVAKAELSARAIRTILEVPR
jgi:DNA-binding NarL/FixJ family response regulator